MSLRQGILKWLTKGTDTMIIEKNVIVKEHHHHHYGSGAGTILSSERKIVARQDGANTTGVKELEGIIS